jgi:hypothetical protein
MDENVRGWPLAALEEPERLAADIQAFFRPPHESARLLSANSCRSRSPREFPVSSRSDQQTDVAMAVEPRRHQGGDPVDHLQGREAQLAAPARTWLGDLI